jgi:hypothetical protein
MRERKPSPESKLGLGAVLAVVGGLGVVLGATVGATELPTPWSFVVGFVVGIVAGLGVALALVGLVERRRES